MRLSILSLAVLSQLAAVTSVSAADNSNIEKISVVGSRLAVRTATDTPVPVDIITAEQLEATGLTETAKALQSAAPSYSFPFSAVTDGSDAVRPASLRGLSPDHALVLVNGKRYHGSALVHLNGTASKGSSNVDLNTIPMTAIKRIEILRDGASAQYGSDAIAGVINVVLKDADEGGLVDAQMGQTYMGDGQQWRIGANKGMKTNEDGFVNVSLEAQHKNSTNRAGNDPRQQYAALEDGSLDPREDTFNRKNHQIGDGTYDNLGVFVNAGQNLSDKSKLYAFGGYSHRENESGAFYRRSLDARNLTSIYPDGFLPKIAPKLTDYTAVVGYKFNLLDWDVDMSAGYGKNEFEYHVKNSLNVSYGDDSPTSFYAGTLSTDELDFNIDASRYIPFYNNSDLMLAVGALWRENGYQIEAGEEASYSNGGFSGAVGSQGFTGFTPESQVDESRHNTGVYAEVENQLTQDFYWAAAARYEYYSDFGSNTSWKLATRYELTDRIALRATANTGFRAPSVQQLYFSNISTLFVNDPTTNQLVPTESGTFNSLSDVAHALGISELKPEKSTSFSGGLVYTGDDGLSITLDAYQIDIDDRIVLSSSVRPAQSEVVADALSTTNAQSARFFLNAVDTRTRGVDLVASKAFSLGSYGDLNTSLAYSYSITDIQSIHLPDTFGDLDPALLFDNVEQVRMTRATPRNKGNVNFTHRYGDFKTSLRFNYYGEYAIAYSNGEEAVYGDKITTDLSVAYSATDDLTVTLGAQNLFDVYPDKAPEDQQFNGIFKYPITNSPFGINGGYYYLDLRYTF
ncbi:TonB-dependent receptor [Shewanella mangrovi]|uniref:TonB-dependent receptor n=1 Tax=Shewanella mangrovi TaxID=1515746 RepID=A0A094LUM7_9GAMM|nr:TonB-dependent receptor [Shewanella mangrovi]KFZ38908.1 TonB-dependent receptor [Shewanella mangrovi]